MSSLVSTSLPLSSEPTRRRLTARQAATVAKLTAAAVDEVRSEGYDGLTVRNVARCAGVAPATAYNYFASKDHLIAEVYWRRLRNLAPTTTDRRQSATTRVSRALADIALLVADEPELAAAVSVAMLATDPDVKLLRDRIGAETHQRIVRALGDDATASVVRTLDFAVSGALLHAGMGHLAYADLPALLADVATTVLGGPR